MHYLTFDIETKTAVASNDLSKMEISVVSVYDSADKSMQSFTEQEFSKMWPLFEKADLLVGYNSEHFDIPILNRYYSGDLTQIKSIDLMVYIRNSFGRRVKMDDIASATLGKKKSSHGLIAVKWWEEGKIDEIKKYCEVDVEITKDLYEFALANGFLKIKDFKGEVIKIPINTSTWNEKKDSSMTFSLPF